MYKIQRQGIRLQLSNNLDQKLEIRSIATRLIHLIFALLLCICFGCHPGTNPEECTSQLWPGATPESQGINKVILDSAFSNALHLGFVDGLLVIRNGFLIKEQYYNGYNRQDSHNIMSVSKSFLSAITGIALHQGYIDSLNQKVLYFFPEYVYPDIDPRKYDITIKHLLTMRMGIVSESENNFDAYQQIYQSDNWLRNTLYLPLLNDPGAEMRYNTFQTHLISAIISKTSGMSMLAYATENLFKAMYIDIDFWEQDPQGYYFGGNSMYFTPQEMAMLGYLYLHNGILYGEQIIPADWVELTLSASTDLTHPNQWGAYENYNYAYLWWLGQISGQKLFMAYGYGGQFVIVFPDLDLIVVSTAENNVYPETSNIQEWAIFDLVGKYIVKALS
jgi:CubicO group peptidase (beta-lactamase class C family)